MKRLPFACTAMCIVALIAAGCAGPAQKEEPVFDKALEQAANEGTLVLADFYTDW